MAYLVYLGFTTDFLSNMYVLVSGGLTAIYQLGKVREQAKLSAIARSQTPGAQYRSHIKNGGYRK